MVEYDELFGGKCGFSCLSYRNQKQVGLSFKRGSRNDFFMMPVSAAKEAIIELQTAIDEAENGRITE